MDTPIVDPLPYLAHVESWEWRGQLVEAKMRDDTHPWVVSVSWLTRDALQRWACGKVKTSAA